jgi:hypothetical protein
MIMAITQEFTFETDDLDEFLKVAKSIFPVLFNAGSNENEEFHKMYYNKSENPRYWILIPDSNGEKVPKRKCVLCLTHHLSKPRSTDEVEIPMEFKLNKKPTWSTKFKWKKKSYQKIIDVLKESVSVDEYEFQKSFPVNGWIKEESDYGDGSYGMNYKMEWKDSCPGSIYVSLGYTYYSK